MCKLSIYVVSCMSVRHSNITIHYISDVSDVLQVLLRQCLVVGSEAEGKCVGLY